ncbi:MULTISPECIES: RbsD/FucU family protein [unclassified Dinoroseobacter]|uniref:RbsD/FucU family protein n=1 Tax=unclassified Dinoroseobacter TaxID=2620028 RepID=UPI003C7996EE
MLIGIDPRTTPELISTLARMGHGDEIVIADRNYPATWSAAGCIEPDVIQYPGHDALEVADLITQLMPLDNFHSHSALRMQIDDQPDTLSEAHKAVWDLLRPRLPEGGLLESIERQAFYDRAGGSFAVVQCSEDRPFGCFILRKGVIF